MAKYVMTFKRFIVFGWADYDNQGPFDCIEGSFDEQHEAEVFIDKAKSEDQLENYRIFDCEKRIAL